MAVWSEPTFRSAAQAGRIDADHFRPEYLRINKLLASAKPLRHFAREIIHPPEFPRRYAAMGWTVVRTQNVRPLRISFDANEVFLPPHIAMRLTQNHIKGGDILITRTGANFGQCSLYTGEREHAICSSHTIIIRVNELIDPAFLSLFLNSSYGRLLIDQGMYGSSQPEIAPRFLRRIPVPRFDPQVEAALASDVRKAYVLHKDSVRQYFDAQYLLEAELGLAKLTFEKTVGYTARASDLARARRADAEYYSPAAREIVKRITALQHSTIRDSFNVGGGFPWNSTKFLPDNSGEPVVRIRNIKPSHVTPDELTSIRPSYANPPSVKASQESVGFPISGIAPRRCAARHNEYRLRNADGQNV